MKSTVFFLLLFIQFKVLPAQISAIDSIDICAGQEVILSVSGNNLHNIGALTLYIGFDTNYLTFISVENIDSQLEGMSTNLMSSPTQLAFAWSNTDPVSFPDTKMFDLKFLSNGSSASVHYNNGCELTDTGGSVIPVNYLNGAVVSGTPLILQNPADTLVTVGGDAFFSVSALNTLTYLWRTSTDNGVSWTTLEDDETFSGTDSPSLHIKSVPLNFDENLYQCILYNGLCQEISEPARLFVEQPSTVHDHISTVSGQIKIYPNPFHECVSIDGLESFCGEFVVSFYNAHGMLVLTKSFIQPLNQSQSIYISTSDFSKGLYIIQLKSVQPFGNLISITKKIEKL